MILDLLAGARRTKTSREAADTIAKNVRDYIDRERLLGRLEKMSGPELADEILNGFGVGL